MSNYENAPATKMLATYCASCSRPLVDAKSVECGMGPDCRKKYGYAQIEALPEADRKEANRLVYAIALAQGGEEVIAAACALRLMGFVKLADRVLDRCADIHVEAFEENGFKSLRVWFPFNVEAVAAVKQIAGRRWDKDAKAWTMPAARREQLWSVLRTFFPGKLGVAVTDGRGFTVPPR